MSDHARGQPGGGCTDPRRIHNHWCGFCGAQLAFGAVECQQLRFVPPCPRCSEKQWRNEIDELTAPDYHEPGCLGRHAPWVTCEEVDYVCKAGTNCLACPTDCRTCSKNEADCECYEHQDCHPDDDLTEEPE